MGRRFLAIAVLAGLPLAAGPPVGAHPAAAPPAVQDVCDGFADPNLPLLSHEPFIPRAVPGLPHFVPGAIADYDNDGDPDLPHLRNDGNLTFTRMNAIRDLIAEAGYGGGASLGFHGVAAYDFDEDGWQDVVLAPYYGGVEGVPILLFRNLGDWQFELSRRDYFESLLGLSETSRWFSETIIVGDLTGDGHNDLYIPFYTHTAAPGQSVFLRNTLAEFVEEAVERGVALSGIPGGLRPEGAQAVDLDADGDLDIYVAHHLFINDGAGHFSDAREQYGLPELFDEGIAFIDYDNDGLLDLYVRAPQKSQQLFRNTGGAFENVSVSSGLACLTKDIPFFWGDSWADFDSDGDLDLLYVRNVQPATYYLFLNQGNGQFRLGYAKERYIHLSATADFDLDGDLDVYRLNAVEENVLARPANAVSLAIVPVDEQGRWNQQGVTVKVVGQCGDSPPVQTRVIGADNVYLAQGHYPAHFAVAAGCAYTIQAAFLAGGGLDREVVSVLYDPAAEGALRVFISRSGHVKELYNNRTLRYYLPLTHNQN